MNHLPELPPDTPLYYRERVKQFQAFAEEFRDESDRGCAVLVLCVLEDAMKGMFEALVVEGTKSELLKNLAPPGGWARMLQNAEMLGLLSTRQCRSLKSLVEVRNAFGHAAQLRLTFDAPDIAKFMNVPTAVPMPPNMRLNDDSRRGRFLFEASMLWIVMTFKTQAIKRLERAGDPPPDGMPGYA